MGEHPAEEFQDDVGESGKFGEVFIGLGILILIGAIVLMWLGYAGAFNNGPAGDAGSRDAILTGWLFAVEGLGFTVFGAFAMLSGWDRQHDRDDVLGTPHI